MRKPLCSTSLATADSSLRAFPQPNRFFKNDTGVTSMGPRYNSVFSRSHTVLGERQGDLDPARLVTSRRPSGGAAMIAGDLVDEGQAKAGAAAGFPAGAAAIEGRENQRALALRHTRTLIGHGDLCQAVPEADAYLDRHSAIALGIVEKVAQHA